MGFSVILFLLLIAKMPAGQLTCDLIGLHKQEDIAIVANSTFPVETITDTTYRNGIINITNIGPFGYTVSNGTFKVSQSGSNCSPE
jgi:hypothetical protein